MIHVLNTQYYTAPYLNRWNRVVFDLLQKNELPVRIIDQYREMRFKTADYTDKCLQYAISASESVLWDLSVGRIKSGDIIVACNGASMLPMILDTYRQTKKFDLKLVTYWENSTNILLSPAWKERRIHKTVRWSWWERQGFRFSDYNLFRNQRECSAFLSGNRIDKMYNSRFEVIPQPYDGILELAKQYDCTKKEDIAVVCEPIVAGTTDRLLIAYKSDVSKLYNITFAVKERLNQKQYYELLAKAKVVIHPNKNTYDYTSILEGLAFGCCVVVPDVADPVFEDIFPHDFKYQVAAVAANKVIRQIRAREAFVDLIRTLMETYNETIYEACLEMAQQLAIRKFNSEPFLNLIKSLNNERK